MLPPSTWILTGQALDHMAAKPTRFMPMTVHTAPIEPAPAMPAEAVTIRRARPEDAPALAALAALDSAQPLHGDILVAELGGTPIAALHLVSGRAIADPFRNSAEPVELLRLRARQLEAAATTPRRARRRHPIAALAGLLR